MNQRPHEPLDAEERALLAKLPRPGGRGEPGPGIDARILASARDAVTGAPRASKPARRRSWIVPVSVAATVTLAVGLAWRLQLPPSTSSEHADAVAVMETNASKPAPPSLEPPTLPAAVVDALPPPMTIPAPPAPAQEAQQHRARDAKATAAPSQARIESADTAAVVAIPPPPPPAPAPPLAPVPAPVTVEAPMAAAPAVADAPALQPPPSVAKQRTVEAAAQRAAAGSSAAPTLSTARKVQAANEAERAALAPPKAFEMDMAEDEVPPATMDTPTARDAWLRRINELVEQGREEEARASLAEFQKRHPTAPIPAKLRALQPTEPLPEPPAD